MRFMQWSIQSSEIDINFGEIAFVTTQDCLYKGNPTIMADLLTAFIDCSQNF
jgi:hypothetical protein